VNNFPLNPGISDTFKWLSTVAMSFEEYDFLELTFIYTPASGAAVASSSAAVGVVPMATDYNANNPPFASKVVMESYEGSNSTPPFASCKHVVKCKRGRNVLDSLYTRNGPLPAGQDKRLNDLGNFQIATQGMQAVYLVGELRVEYTVLLKKPRSPAVESGGGDDPIPPQSWIYARGFPVDTASAANGFFGATGPQVVAGDLDQCIFRGPGGSSTYLGNAGFYLVFARAENNLSTGWTGTVSPDGFSGNITTGPPIFDGGTHATTVSSQEVSAPIIGTSNSMTIVQVLASGDPTNPDPNTFTFTNSTGLTSGNFDLLIFAIGPPPSSLGGLPTPNFLPMLRAVLPRRRLESKEELSFEKVDHVS